MNDNTESGQPPVVLPFPNNGASPSDMSSTPQATDGDTGSSRASSPELQAFWSAVKRLPAYARLAKAIMQDPDVPKDAKIALGAGGAYALSPIDLIPGVIPVAGQLDDLYALLTGLRFSLKRMPDEVAARILAEATVTPEDIDRDLAAVRQIVKLAAKQAVRYGGKFLGRISRAAVALTRDQIDRQRQRRDGGSE